MKTSIFALCAFSFLAPATISAHCQIPCGIYNDNNIIESDESNNYWSLSDKMGSNNRFLDPLLEAIATYSVPVIIIGATIALGGVAVVVIWGRRIEAMKEYAEKRSMMVYTDDDMEF